MAKQTGIATIRGTVGNLTFTQNGKTNGVQQKMVVPESRFKSDKWERVRENAAEFTNAANGSNILRTAFHALFNNFKDKNMVQRLHGLMMVIVKADAINNRGERNIAGGPIHLLEGFQLNELVIFEKAFVPQITKTYDRVTGEIKLAIPAVVPKFNVKGVEGATHFKFLSGAAEIDFKTGESNANFQMSAPIPWNEEEFPAQTLTHILTPNSTKDVVVVLGIQYYQVIGNGREYPLKSNLHNSMAIVKADR